MVWATAQPFCKGVEWLISPFVFTTPGPSQWSPMPFGTQTSAHITASSSLKSRWPVQLPQPPARPKGPRTWLGGPARMGPICSGSLGNQHPLWLPLSPSGSSGLPGGEGLRVPLRRGLRCSRCFPSLWWDPRWDLTRKANYKGKLETFRHQQPQSQG